MTRSRALGCAAAVLLAVVGCTARDDYPYVPAQAPLATGDPACSDVQACWSVLEVARNTVEVLGTVVGKPRPTVQGDTAVYEVSLASDHPEHIMFVKLDALMFHNGWEHVSPPDATPRRYSGSGEYTGHSITVTVTPGPDGVGSSALARIEAPV